MDRPDEMQMLRDGWLADARRAKVSMRTLRRLLELVHGIDTTSAWDVGELERLAETVIDRHQS